MSVPFSNQLRHLHRCQLFSNTCTCKWKNLVDTFSPFDLSIVTSMAPDFKYCQVLFNLEKETWVSFTDARKIVSMLGESKFFRTFTTLIAAGPRILCEYFGTAFCHSFLKHPKHLLLYGLKSSPKGDIFARTSYTMLLHSANIIIYSLIHEWGFSPLRSKCR